MRFIVAAVAVLIGVGLILTGLGNVRTRTSEETGVRRRVNDLAGASNTSTGGRAVAQGWIRVATGIAAIGFGIWFALFGPA
ncbi:MAG TPA: hypothetical protein VF367_01660 [Candidatus Limnocylindria bacterium]|jgi:hypothetical protein